ncbi:MAG TPA: MurR/RpiR family transcriptional regulator [Candidatus Binatia bacterium]|nr:MurR/RpiR family transcriptional regulator [Candidatus Binatia bacterium]
MRTKAAHSGTGQRELLQAKVLQPLRDSYDSLTKTEKKIASYFLSRPDCLVLETAATIAGNVGVSPMTVGRFLRKLGFDGVSDVRHSLKADLYGPEVGSLWSIDRRYQAFTEREAGHFSRQDSLEAELAAIRKAYEFTATPLWARAVDSFAHADRVFVSGLHMARGLALEFVSRLEYIRPGVHNADGQNGHYADVMFDEAPRIAFMLIDFYRYDKATQRAAELAKRRGHEVHILVDSYCVWAHKVTDSVFNLPTSTGLYWHSNAAMSVLLNLLVNDVIKELGKAVPKRIDKVVQAQRHFDQFAEDL